MELIDKGQYSFQLTLDGSILQIFYNFCTSTEIERASLAYYSTGLEDDCPVGWLRFDYDNSSDRGLYHPISHLHISLFPNCRIALNKIPSPRQFIEFVICYFYPEIYKEKGILDDEGNLIDKDRMKNINQKSSNALQRDYLLDFAHIFFP